MMLVEASVFLLFLAGFCTWLLLSDRLTEWKDRRQARVVSRAIDRLQGEPIEAVLDRFWTSARAVHRIDGPKHLRVARPPSAAIARYSGSIGRNINREQQRAGGRNGVAPNVRCAVMRAR